MDRFIVKEPRMASGIQHGNAMIALNPGNNSNQLNVCLDNNFYQGTHSASDFPSMPRNPSSTVPYNSYNLNAMSPYRNDMMPGQVQACNVSGIDPNYLAAFKQNAAFIATGQQQPHKPMQVNSTFGSEYQNNSFIGAERNSTKQFIHRATEKTEAESKNLKLKSNFGTRSLQRSTEVSSKSMPKSCETNEVKTEVQIQAPLMTRAEKLKALQKSGPRVFTGTVEKVLKWHKALQDIGILIIYEIIGKCVSVRAAEGCKVVVVRDEGGPAMQLRYHEVDFLLPPLQPPCTIRAVGRMPAGSRCLAAFCVRAASGHDVCSLSRRAAAADHHAAKLARDYTAP